jgi:hypothetical protein
MAAGDRRIGLDGVFYYGDAGSQADTEASNVDNVRVQLSARTAEAVERGKSFVTKKPTVLEPTLTFDVADKEGDAFVAALESAAYDKTRLALYPTDASSGKGLDADYYITEFSRSETNTQFITYSVTAVPTDESRDPVWQ